MTAEQSPAGIVTRKPPKLRVFAIIILSQLVTACVVPGHMHVTEGVAPQNLDINVRFRTTYYFRAFDYCWNANASLDEKLKYRDIVPETDTLYRYRMTGKASALANQIKFESGVLSASQIEPFGADVTYNSDINGFLYRSPQAAKAQADDAAAARAKAAGSADALARFRLLSDIRKQFVAAGTDTTAIDAAIKDALAAYLGTPNAAGGAEAKEQRTELTNQVDSLKAQVDRASAATAAPEVLDKLSARLAELEKTAASAKAASTYCAADEIRRHGFQIMGPEGMRPYDQDARLIMAMHSSAKPLIETLSEYSGRLLKPRMNPAEQLLPLARETTTIVQSQRALDRVSTKIAEGGDAPPKVDDVFAAAITAFTSGKD
jgi:hypothetical protein